MDFIISKIISEIVKGANPNAYNVYTETQYTIILNHTLHFQFSHHKSNLVKNLNYPKISLLICPPHALLPSTALTCLIKTICLGPQKRKNRKGWFQ